MNNGIEELMERLDNDEALVDEFAAIKKDAEEVGLPTIELAGKYAEKANEIGIDIAAAEIARFIHPVLEEPVDDEQLEFITGGECSHYRGKHCD